MKFAMHQGLRTTEKKKKPYRRGDGTASRGGYEKRYITCALLYGMRFKI